MDRIPSSEKSDRAVRSADNQSAHDIAVHLVVTEYLQSGYRVQADVRGYERPYSINGWIPDVVATRLKYTRGQVSVFKTAIVEVEPEELGKFDSCSQEEAAFPKDRDRRPQPAFPNIEWHKGTGMEGNG